MLARAAGGLGVTFTHRPKASNPQGNGSHGQPDSRRSPLTVRGW